MGFPALHSDPPWLFDNAASPTGASKASRFHLASAEMVTLFESVSAWHDRVPALQHGFFLAKRVGRSAGLSRQSAGPGPDALKAPSIVESSSSVAWQIGSLRQYEQGFFAGATQDDCFVCFADPSTDPEYPGWMLRNLLVLIRERWALERVGILCYRAPYGRSHKAQGLVLNLHCPPDSSKAGSNAAAVAAYPKVPKITGWERTNGRLTSKVANLGEHMDPIRSAEVSHYLCDPTC